MKVIMYNHANQHIMEVDEGQIERLAESGWRKVSRGDLVAVFNPGLNDHKVVLRTELARWTGAGYYAEPTIVYHPEKGKKMVSADMAEEMCKNGWFDSPAKFKMSTLVSPRGGNIPMPSSHQAQPEQTVATETETVTVDLGKPLTKMTKAELAQHYLDTYGETLDLELTKDQMIDAFKDASEASAA